MNGGSEGRGRRIRWTAALAVLVAGGVAISLRMGATGSGELAGRGVLVASVLLGLLRLAGEVRRSLRAQRGEPLRALSRVAYRRGAVPGELLAIVGELRTSRRSRTQFAKGLGSRLARALPRDGRGANDGTDPVSPVPAGTSAGWRGRARQQGEQGSQQRDQGMSLREIEAAVRAAEEG